MKRVKVGIIGSGFQATAHAESLIRVADAEIIGVASPTKEHVKAFAQKYNIPHHFTDYQRLLEMEEIDVVTLAVPNYLHARITVDAAKAGKHVICEKPLCMNLQEADSMIEVCKENNVKLMYAEELCFTPKYVRAKQLVDEGALGNVYLVKQSERHFGPHADWFWDIKKSGGGVLMDMGCHAFEFFRWIFNKVKVESVYAEIGTYVHKDRTRGEDNSIVIVTFEKGKIGLAEDSWGTKGGMDDRVEIYGSEGLTYANLHKGISLVTYSDRGYGYAVEKAPTTKGWSFTIYEELWNYGFPQEMEHFISCVKNDEEPFETGEDGRAVLEMIFAAYESAKKGKKVKLPFRSEAKKPIDLYLET